MLKNLLSLIGLSGKTTQDSLLSAEEGGPATSEDEELTDTIMDDPFAKMLINVQEDGDFALAVDFDRIEHPNAAEVMGYIIHMMNSGHLAEFMVEALNLWADEDIEKRAFVVDILQNWKDLYEESEKLTKRKSEALAVDPADVFGLNRLRNH